MHDEVNDKLTKWQEPPDPKRKKALPVPVEKPKKRRGGKRYTFHTCVVFTL
jgi:U4/U6 small nuclear ribonucleoprotein PRP31